MKKRLVLERTAVNLTEESERYIAASKTVINIEISFIETEDLIKLKKLEDEQENFKEELKNIEKLDERFKDYIDKLYNNDIDELIIFKSKLNRINENIEDCLYDLKIKSEDKIKSLDIDNLTKKQVSLFGDYTDLKTKQKKLYIEMDAFKSSKQKEVDKKYLDLIESKDIIKKRIYKNNEEQDVIHEKLRLVKEKTNEEIYNEILFNSTTFIKTENREIADDGKFYANVEYYIKEDKSNDWQINNKAGTEFYNVDDLLDYLNIHKNKDFFEMNIKKDLNFKKAVAIMNKSEDFKNVKSMIDTKQKLENDIIEIKQDILKVDNLIKDTNDKLEKSKTIVLKAKREFHSIIKKSKEVISSFKNNVDSLVNKYILNFDSQSIPKENIEIDKEIKEDINKLDEDLQKSLSKEDKVKGQEILKKQKQNKKKGWFKW